MLGFLDMLKKKKNHWKRGGDNDNRKIVIRIYVILKGADLQKITVMLEAIFFVLVPVFKKWRGNTHVICGGSPGFHSPNN